MPSRYVFTIHMYRDDVSWSFKKHTNIFKIHRVFLQCTPPRTLGMLSRYIVRFSRNWLLFLDNMQMYLEEVSWKMCTCVVRTWYLEDVSWKIIPMYRENMYLEEVSWKFISMYRENMYLEEVSWKFICMYRENMYLEKVSWKMCTCILKTCILSVYRDDHK